MNNFSVTNTNISFKTKYSGGSVIIPNCLNNSNLLISASPRYKIYDLNNFSLIKEFNNNNIGNIFYYIIIDDLLYYISNGDPNVGIYDLNSGELITFSESEKYNNSHMFYSNNKIYIVATTGSKYNDKLFEINSTSYNLINNDIGFHIGNFSSNFINSNLDKNNNFLLSYNNDEFSYYYFEDSTETFKELPYGLPFGKNYINIESKNIIIKDTNKELIRFTFDSLNSYTTYAINNNSFFVYGTYNNKENVYRILPDLTISELNNFDLTIFELVRLTSITNKVFLYDINYDNFIVDNIYYGTYENIPPNPNPDSGDNTGNMTPTNPDTEGGDGNFDNTNDNIDRPTLPVVDASAIGMLALYNPTGGELQQFADFLWSPNFYQSIQRFFSDTADAVINLGIVPVIIPEKMEKKDVSICALRSGVKMNVINNQYVEFSLGKIKIEKYFGSFLDYAPYTNIQIYIPFVGYQTLNTDEIMGNEILLYYHVDLATGNFTCHLQVIRADVFYIANIFTGNMMSKYCISSRSFDQLISAGITAAGTIASAGLGALAATSSTTAATSTATMAAKSASAGSTTALATQGTRAISTNVNIPLNNFAPPEPTDPPVPNVNNVIVKPPIIRTGSLSGSDPLFAPKEAFIIINRPNPAIADKYSSFYGFRANYTETLSNLSGYTKVSAVNLKGFESATLEEKQTIKDQLISGIIL